MLNKRPVRNQLSNQAGLSMLEVILAIALITISITALVVLGNAATSSSGTARDRSVANQYLRQTMEQVRVARDNSGWNDGIINVGGSALAVSASRVYSVNSSGALVYQSGANPAAANACTYTTGATYQLTGNTRFARSVKLTRTTADTVTVTGTVCYNFGTQVYKESTQTVISNWR